jgi:hypothetical protein
MRTVYALVFMLLSSVIVIGCPAVVNDVGQVTICVEQAILAQVQAGQTTFEDIAVAVGSACGAITAVEVQNIINLWTSGATPDGGTLPYNAGTPEMQAKLKAVKSKGK